MAGIEIRIDTSWVLIAALVTLNLYGAFAERFLRLSVAGRVALGLTFALLFFGSVLAHELAHAIVARRRGIEVHGITLFLFGGATHAKAESRRPQDEFVISVVGPLMSLLLGGAFLVLARGVGWPETPLAWGFGYLGAVNIVLAVFNMLPGFPLDGGRVLRALVWRATGSFARATKIASIGGQILGYLLVAGGVYYLTRQQVDNGLWLVLIGWFLAQAARLSQETHAEPRNVEEVEAATAPPPTDRDT